jgi:hypothetical protein
MSPPQWNTDKNSRKHVTVPPLPVQRVKKPHHADLYPLTRDLVGLEMGREVEMLQDP